MTESYIVNGRRILIPNAPRRSALAFVLTLIIDFAILLIYIRYFIKVDYDSILLVMLIPNLAFTFYVRYLIKNSSYITQIAITEEGIEELKIHAKKPLANRFVAWEFIESVKEKPERGRDNSKQLTISIKDSTQALQFSTRENTLADYDGAKNLMIRILE